MDLLYLIAALWLVLMACKGQALWFREMREAIRQFRDIVSR
jgi:hypothetical protein